MKLLISRTLKSRFIICYLFINNFISFPEVIYSLPRTKVTDWSLYLWQHLIITSKAYTINFFLMHNFSSVKKNFLLVHLCRSWGHLLPAAELEQSLIQDLLQDGLSETLPMLFRLYFSHSGSGLAILPYNCTIFLTCIIAMCLYYYFIKYHYFIWLTF